MVSADRVPLRPDTGGRAPFTPEDLAVLKRISDPQVSR